jgi:hypothetical protein
MATEESAVMSWIEKVTGERFGQSPFGDTLKDGVILCRLVNCLHNGSIPEKNISTSRIAFKQLENIKTFLEAIRGLGVNNSDCFDTPDLFEQRNLANVAHCIYCLALQATKILDPMNKRIPEIAKFQPSQKPLAEPQPKTFALQLTPAANNSFKDTSAQYNQIGFSQHEANVSKAKAYYGDTPSSAPTSTASTPSSSMPAQPSAEAVDDGLSSIVMCGYMQKKGDKGLIKTYKKRWFELWQSGQLFYFATEDSSAEPKGSFHMDEIEGIDDDDEGKFVLLTENRDWFLKCQDSEEKAEWCNAIKNLADEHDRAATARNAGMSGAGAGARSSDRAATQVAREPQLSAAGQASNASYGSKDVAKEFTVGAGSGWSHDSTSTVGSGPDGGAAKPKRKGKRGSVTSMRLETDAMKWIEAVTGERFGKSPLADTLRDGVILCRLINKIAPSTIPSSQVSSSSVPFKQKENIRLFLQAAKRLGVKQYETFEVDELHADTPDKQDTGRVLQCIHSLAGVARSMPSFAGPKEFGKQGVAERAANGAAPQDWRHRKVPKKWGAGCTGQTFMGVGSAAVMERSKLDRTNDIAFGAKSAGGEGARGEVSQLNSGSQKIMQRTKLDTTNDITFGADPRRHQPGK